MEFNPFLGNALAGAKGGGQLIEDPACVANIAFQTRGGPLAPFEQRLAEDLMQVFGDGYDALPDVVAALAAIGSLDPAGAAWTEASLATQFARSAGGLFAPVEGGIDG